MVPGCSNKTSTFTRLSDLKQGTYQGFVGGLYPNGHDRRPPANEAEGVKIATLMHPLNGAGDVDYANGKLVLAIFGTSATNIIAPSFIAYCGERMEALNKKLVILNLSRDGKTIDELADPNDGYWKFVKSTITASGLTKEQVQLGWMQCGQRDPPAPFPAHAIASQAMWEAAVANARATLPNFRMAWLSGPLYQGYATPPLTVMEPAYGEQSFAIKWAVEKYINGGLPKLPFMSMGFDIWAPGLPRGDDGFDWDCPADVRTGDKRHPSVTGADKIAAFLFNHFRDDPCSRPWFMDLVAGGPGGAPPPAQAAG